MPVLEKPSVRRRRRDRWSTGPLRLKAVLRPWAGRLLPRELRAQNVAWLVARWPEGVRAPEFEELVARIDAASFHCGDRVEVFHRGYAAVAAIEREIDAAREEVLVETYILKDDDAGHGLLQTLARAAARGVAVKVLADAAGSWATKRRFWEEMERNGIETRLFHPLAKIRDLMVRDHRKIVVVDRRVGFTGGLNVGNEYGSTRRVSGDLPWRDTHVRLQGTTAWELAIVFNEGWVHAGGGPLDITPLVPCRAPDPRTLVLDSRSGRGHAETASVLIATMAAARRRLWLTNAYFAPHPLVLASLCAAARRGVDVRLLLPGQSDMPLVRRAGHGCFAELLASGARIFEYQPVVMHAKTLVVDDWATMIGSSNLDYRSYYFNAECNVLILDADVGRGMADAFLEDLRDSVEITLDVWDQRSCWKQMGDALARGLSPVL